MRAKVPLTRILAVLMIAAVTTPSFDGAVADFRATLRAVTDPNGAVVVGARSPSKSNATREARNTTTSSNGVYRFALLPPGTHTISDSAQCFSKAEALPEPE